jgi:hypothetical protein
MRWHVIPAQAGYIGCCGWIRGCMGMTINEMAATCAGGDANGLARLRRTDIRPWACLN